MLKRCTDSNEIR